MDRNDQLLGIRVYKVYDQEGNIIPYHYIVLQDYIQDGCGPGMANCDWNDNVEYFINIKPVDDASVVSAIDDLTVVAGTSFNYDVSIFFAHGYPGNRLTYSTSVGGNALPNWLSFDVETGIFSGTPPASAVASALDIAVMATDVNGMVVFDEETTSFTITITDGNSTARVGQTLAVGNGKSSEAALLTIPVIGKEVREGGSRYLAYPNPVGKIIHIKFSAQLQGKTNVQLSDPMGRTLLDRTFSLDENEGVISLDLSGINMSPGIFFLKITPTTTAGSILRLIKE